MLWYGIVPVNHYRLADNMERHLVIGPYLTEEAVEYFKTKDNVIVDNGAWERVSMSDEDLIELGNAISAEFVAVPDTLKETTKTLKQLKSFKSMLSPKDNFKLLGAAQGRNKKEVMHCIAEMIDEVDRIALPKHLGEELRAEIIRTYSDYVDFHLFGVSDINKMTINAYSFDTSWPVKCALNNQDILTRAKMPKFPIDCKLTPAQLKLAELNIADFKYSLESRHVGSRKVQ